jgi:hypothetical protein
LILSFPAGEEPDNDVLRAMERRACEELGFAEHQRVSVVHHDTDHLHVHVAINRVHPKNYRVHWPSYSKLVLDRLCVELEQEHGLRATRHRAAEREAQSERRAPDSERLGGIESLIGWIQRGCGEQLRAARSWTELHETAAANGLELKLRGNGLVFVARSRIAVKASTIARDLSKAALERRLGPFEVATALTPVSSEYRQRPLERDERAARLYERYRVGREVAFNARGRVLSEFRQGRGQDEEQLTRASRRRWATVRLMAKGRVGWALWAAYARHVDRRERERARDRDRDLVLARPKGGWLEWLRDQAARGDDEALALLRSRRRAEPRLSGLAISSDAIDPVRAGARADSVTASGTIIYSIPGGTIRDDGKRLRLAARDASDTAVEALLRLAHERYGARLGVDGDAGFQAQIVRVAAAIALPITLADPQLEQRRLELRNRTTEDAGRGRGPRSIKRRS